MMFVIDSLNPSQTAKRTLDEIDTLIAFTGRKPEKVALFPHQFHQVKHGCLVALRRKLRAEVKQLSGGGRLRNNQLTEYLDAQDYADHEQAETLVYKGIVLYNKAEALAPSPSLKD